MKTLQKINKVVKVIYKVKSIDKMPGVDETTIVNARKTFCILARKLTKYSHSEIGLYLKIENHSLIVYYCKKAKHHILMEKEFNKNYNECLKIIGGVSKENQLQELYNFYLKKTRLTAIKLTNQKRIS